LIKNWFLRLTFLHEEEIYNYVLANKM